MVDSVPPLPRQSANPTGFIEREHIHNVIENEEQGDSFAAS